MKAIGFRVGSIRPLKHHVVKTCQSCDHDIYLMVQTIAIVTQWTQCVFVCRQCEGLEG